MKTFLKTNKGFTWYKNHRIFIKGYFYDGNNIFYEKDNALIFFENIKTTDDFEKKLKSLNGVFSIIISFKETSYIYSDITRCFPLFYIKQNKKFFISDEINYLKSLFKLSDFDELSELEFKASNHTYGKKTLLKDVYQVQASECIVIENNKIIKSFFNYSYAIEKENILEFKYLKEKAIIAFENSFKRCLDSLQNRVVAIPLSGGFDSRLITVFLKKHNYRNVICFTYGSKNSFEIENSKKVANKLGFKWYFIEYSQEIIGDFLNDNQFKEYINFASKLSSMPSLQEYFAVKYLQKNNLIPNNAIFISGFAGDLLGGSQFSKVIPRKLTFNAISSLIVDKKLINYPIKTRIKNELKQNINQQLLEFDKDCHNKLPTSVFEDFDIKEKISKFIFNSASFYSFFNYEFRFPFWDKELLDFFKEVPVELKYNKLLFDDVLINKYFKPFNVFFENEIKVKTRKKWINRIRKKVKPILPSFMKEKRLEKLSWMNYKNITQEMLFFLKKKNINIKRAYNGYNEIIAQWYIYVSKNGFD